MFEVLMPKAGQTVEEGTIVVWSKAEGQAIQKDEVLAEIETDKAVFELESPAAGTLLKILHPEGSVVPVHAVIALIGRADEDVQDYLTSHPQVLAVAEPDTTARPAVEPASGRRTVPRESRPEMRSSPAARRAAQELGVDLSRIGRGSGPEGVITADDVTRFAKTKDAAAGGPALPSGEPVRRPLDKARKAIADATTLSKQTIPHFYVKVTVDAAPLEAFCAPAKAGSGCSINEGVVFACALAMREFPGFRSRLEGGEIVEYPRANVGIVVAAKDAIVIPVVIGAGAMSFEQFVGEARRVVAAARNGKLEGAGKGTFAVTNLGMYGVDEFTAIINPPESGILAVGAIRDAAVAAQGSVHAGRVMSLVLSADHRIVDGVIAAKFLSKVREFLEKPGLMESASSRGAQQ